MPNGSTKNTEGELKTKDRELSFREQAFVACYLQEMNATKAALMAGYAESVAKTHAWSWVSITGCPDNKLHVRRAVTEELEKMFEKEQINSDWVLRRAKLLADFNIRKFITVNDKGEAVYDFREATGDDWYCIEEYTTETRTIIESEAPIHVSKIKLKAPSKVATLKLIGDHIAVQAFRTKIEQETVSVQYTMSQEEYLEARKLILEQDDC